MSEPAKEKFELVEITEEEVEMTVRNLSNKLSTGPNGISNKTLKEILPLILKHFTTCINKSFTEMIFPEILKISKITPLYKKDDRKLPVNYRPIAQLSPLSKTLEQLCMTQITEFLERNNILEIRR